MFGYHVVLVTLHQGLQLELVTPDTILIKNDKVL